MILDKTILFVLFMLPLFMLMNLIFNKVILFSVEQHTDKERETQNDDEVEEFDLELVDHGVKHEQTAEDRGGNENKAFSKGKLRVLSHKIDEHGYIEHIDRYDRNLG